MPLETPSSPFYMPLLAIDSSNCLGETSEFEGICSDDSFVADSDNLLVRYLNEPNNIENGNWPIVLFGVSGTGKTSLATTLVANFAQIRSKKAFVYTADGFRRKLASVVETNSKVEFRNQLKNAAAVLIDDIQRLKKYPAAQAELAVLLDILAESNTPIVCTISESELNSSAITPGLSSRMSAGLCIRVNQPGKEARIKLFADSASKLGIEIKPDALEYLATVFAVTFPKIRSFFHLFVNWQQAKPQKSEIVDCSNIIEFLASLVGSSQDNIDIVIQAVAKHFDLRPEDIKSSSRKQSIVLARSVCIYLLRNLMSMSFSRIGQEMGNRDHSTVMHSLERANYWIEINKNNLGANVEKLRIAILESCFLNSENLCVQVVD